jgi:hypothetical protein
VPEQTYRGTHRHRAPLGWHPQRVQQQQPSTNGDAETPPGEPEPTAPFTPTFTGQLPAVSDAAPPEPAERLPAAVEDLELRRWTFVFVVAAVWIVAAAVGLGLFYWWFHSINKTPAVFVVLVYVVVCTVAALIAAMVRGKPVMSAIGIALMSAPFASTAAAAVLYGVYFCEHASRCFAGVLPY